MSLICNSSFERARDILGGAGKSAIDQAQRHLYLIQASAELLPDIGESLWTSEHDCDIGAIRPNQSAAGWIGRGENGQFPAY